MTLPEIVRLYNTILMMNRTLNTKHEVSSVPNVSEIIKPDLTAVLLRPNHSQSMVSD